MKYIKIETVLMLLISVVGFFGVRTLTSVDTSLEKVTNSVSELNKTMATVVTELSYQRRDIDKHTEQISEIQKQFKGKLDGN